MRLMLPTPPSANRYWRTYRNRVVRSDEAVAYKAEVARIAQQQLPPTDKMIRKGGKVGVVVHWVRQRRAGDLDNRLKVLFDALEGICYEKDSQIVEIHAYRRDKNPELTVFGAPGAYVYVWRIP
jgi:crossover junction endodeoxyribonuclease RusA